MNRHERTTVLGVIILVCLFISMVVLVVEVFSAA